MPGRWDSAAASDKSTLLALNTSGQVMPSGAPFTIITNWTAVADAGGLLNPTTGRVTVQETGFYLVSGSILASSALAQNNNLYLSVLKNGSEVLRGTYSSPAAGGSTTNPSASVTGVLKLTAGDVLTLGVTQFSGSGVTLFSAGVSNTFSVARIA